ncbi:MAG: putative toxin-antitoxin system toxin component, PIN family [Rhodocyclaceae bacterium]|nr:putative toxin-antitoxin system toxin component, PIN family [Rhodocyclaceae bacterium]
MTHPPRLVLDTNSVLSALVFAQGRLSPLRLAWQQARCQPLVSRTTVGELIRVLAYPKFRLDPDEQQELLADYLPYCTVVTIPARPPKTPACRDPFDVPFLQLAIAGKADYLVTGDRDLLNLEKAASCSIVTPAQFLGVLAPAPR